MQSHYSEFQQRNVQVLAISTDAPEDSKRLVDGLGLSFRILSDPQLQATEAYGLRHVGGNPMENSDIARPGTFLIDEAGLIQWRELTENWRVRLRPERVLKVLDSFPAP